MVDKLMGTAATEFAGLRVVVCGSASPLGNDPDRAQACIAVVTPEHLFLFDVGAGSPQKIQAAQLPINRLTAVFLTHFHSDHIAALPDVNLNSRVLGRTGHLQVLGPTGVDKVVAGFNLAYQLDTDYRIAHHGTDLMPRVGAELEATEIKPGIVWKDDKITVSAFLVDHSPISPALGYRVDYGDRSVVISGDTIAVASLFEAAAKADLLFHDALSPSVIRIFIDSAKKAGRDRIARIMQDVTDYHADITALESMSQSAGVKQLVLYHLVPVPANILLENMFRQDIGSATILADDLMYFDLPAGSSDIIMGKL